MLIDKTNIYAVRQISKSVRDDKINPHIEDAEFLDVRPLLGELLYDAIVGDPANAEYIKILEPFTYTYDGKDYSHLGLKRVISLYSYSRYVLFGSYTDTGFGFVEKSTQDSVPVGDAHKRTIYKKDQEAAYKYWSEIEAYLNRNASTYPLWDSECTDKRGSFKISKITIGGSRKDYTDCRGRGITDEYHG